MDCLEIKTRLENKGYSVSPNYGLISEKSDGEIVIADIRKCEELIVIPYCNKTEIKGTRRLAKIVHDEKIPFREKPRTSD